MEISKLKNFFIINSNSQIFENKILSEEIISILYGKGYDLIFLESYKSGIKSKEIVSVLNDIDDIKRDCKFLMDNLNINSFIIKNESNIYLIEKNKPRKKLILEYYKNSDKIYIKDGISFSFKEIKEYRYISNKNEIKNGMILEICNNSNWIEKKVQNIDIEYENIFKPFLQYNKIRYCSY